VSFFFQLFGLICITKLPKERAKENGLKSLSQEVVKSAGFYFRFWIFRWHSDEAVRGIAFEWKGLSTLFFKNPLNNTAQKIEYFKVILFFLF